MDMKWLIAAIAAVILIGGGFLFLNQNKNASNNTANPAPTAAMEASPTTEAQVSPSGVMKDDKMMKENKITLSKNGFSPANLTIKAGTKVTWENEDNGLSTVNSDPHPAHTNYPPLNLGRFNDGESLSLTFDKPGTYGYHNHLNPSQKAQLLYSNSTCTIHV